MANQPSDLRPGDDPRPNPPYGLWHNLRGANGQDAGVVSTPLRAALSPVGGSLLSSFRGFLCTSAAAAKSSGTKQSAAAPPVGNQPLSLAPDGHGHSAASSRSREPAATGIAAEASSGGGYAVAVASERSAADADAVFRSLQAKFPNQLGGREPIVRRTDLGPEGIYYQALIGPFVQ